MTCYHRHLGWLFQSLGLEYEKATRDRVHSALVEMLDLEQDAHCPEVWAELKQRYGIDTRTESAELAADLQQHLART